MELKKLYKDYEAGITVYQTGNKDYEVIERESDGMFLLYEKSHKNEYDFTGIMGVTLQQCEMVIRGRDRWKKRGR